MRGRHLEREETGDLLAMAGERAENMEGDGINNKYETRGEPNGKLQLGVEQGSDAAVCRGYSRDNMSVVFIPKELLSTQCVPIELLSTQ